MAVARSTFTIAAVAEDPVGADGGGVDSGGGGVAVKVIPPGMAGQMSAS
jgi:hypothetical protein